MPGKPKHYTPEFKEQAARKVVDSSPPRTITEVARELSIKAAGRTAKSNIPAQGHFF